MYICLLGLEQWASANDSFFGVNSEYLNYATGALVIFGVGAALLKGSRPLSLSPSWSLLMLYALIVLSYSWAISRESAMMMINHAWMYVIAYIFLLPLTLNSFEDLKDAVLGMAVGGAIVGLMILLGTEMVGNRNIAFAEGATNRYGRIESGGNPLAIGELGAMIAFSAAIMRVSGVARALMLILRWGMIAVGLALVFRSGSRGQTFAVLGLLPIFMVIAAPKFRPKQLVAPAIGIAFVAGIGLWASSFIPESTLSRWSPDSLTSDYGHRIWMCQVLMEEWLHSNAMHWLFGLGFGASWSLFDNYPHVVVIQVLGELGIVGLSLYLIFYTGAAVSWFRFVNLIKTEPALRATAVVFGAFAAFEFVLSFKQGGISGAHAFWVFPAILMRCVQIARRAKAMRSGRHAKWVPVPTWQPANS
jgi:hypothetical protein